MKAKFIGMYVKSTEVTAEDGTVSRTSKPIYRYIVLGTEEETNAYIAKQEEEGYEAVIDEVTGKPIFFSIDNVGLECPASFNQDGRLFLQDDEMTMLRGELNASSIPEEKASYASMITQLKLSRIREVKGFKRTVKAEASATTEAKEPAVEGDDAQL